MGRPSKLHTLVLETVRSLGECTIAQVVSLCGKRVSAASAARFAHRARLAHLKHAPTKSGCPARRGDPLSIGRRLAVTYALQAAVNSRKIQRVRKGVYAPVLVDSDKEEE